MTSVHQNSKPHKEINIFRNSLILVEKVASYQTNQKV